MASVADLAGPAAAEAYRRLWEEGGPLTAAEQDRLLALGLAYRLPDDPSVLMAAAPLAALEALLARTQQDLVTQYQSLARAHQAAAELRARPELEGADRTPRRLAHRLVRVLGDPEEISALSSTIGAAAMSEHLTMETFKHDVPMNLHAGVPPVPAVRARGVRHRALYETAFLADPVASAILAQRAERGEEIRLLPRLPMKLKITDRSQALLPLTHTGTSAALHLRSQVAIDALRQFFEMCWQEARPYQEPKVPAAGAAQDAAWRTIAVLLGQGLKDEAVARRLGITARTVRRRVNELMKELSVETRFAAGAAAQRRGWLGDAQPGEADRI